MDPTTLHSLSIQDIMMVLPHRYPFLLIDRLEDVVLGQKAVGLKNVTFNEPFFKGHFPGSPVMPGVLIIEAMAQTAGVLVMKTLDICQRDFIVYFMSIAQARFRKPVIPGDRLFLSVEKQHQRGKVWKFQGRAFVENQIVAEAVYTAMIRARSESNSLEP